MSLSALPSEIITCILSKVASILEDPAVAEQDIWTTQHSLWALSQCSRRLHELVEPFLYASFFERNDYTLLPFLRTILEAPRLAAFVKTYEGRPTRGFMHHEATVAFPSTRSRLHQNGGHETNAMILLAIQRGKINDEGSLRWLGDIIQGSWDAATALAIINLPNLQTLNLKITIPESSDSEEDYRELDATAAFDVIAFKWINRSLRVAQEHQSSGQEAAEHSMRKLDTIRLSLLEDAVGMVFVSSLLAFLGLASLKIFEAYGLWLDDDLGDRVSFSLPTLSIADIGLGSALILKCFTNVQKLHLASRISMDPSEFICAMTHLSRSLRELTIVGSGTNSPRFRPSLASFEVLEKLDIVAPHLISWDLPRRHSWDLAMPTNLKHLTVRKCEESTVQAASRLVDRKLLKLCKLESLYLEFLMSFIPEDAEKEVELLRKKCVEADVNFKVTWDGRR